MAETKPCLCCGGRWQGLNRTCFCVLEDMQDCGKCYEHCEHLEVARA